LIHTCTKHTTVLQTALALTLRTGPTINDPVITTFNLPPALVGVATSAEIAVYHPGETIRIYPKNVTVSALGVVIITIPRSRLKRMDLDGNDPMDPMYIDDANFITTIDVNRLYYDNTDGANLVWNAEDCTYTPGIITDTLQVAYPIVKNARLGELRLYPAVYDAVAHTWTKALLSKPSMPQYARLSYLSGRQISMSTEIQTAKLTHTLESTFLPERMNLLGSLWKEDKSPSKPMILTPYGSMMGAVHVWMQDSRSKIGHAGKF
jgi:hypothetical protein